MTTTPSADVRSASDLLNLDDEFSAAELELRARVREFVDRRVRPHIGDWFDRAHFPVELVPELAELGLLGLHLPGYGCAGGTAVEYGIAIQELEAGDSGIRTFVSVQGSLAMSAIHKHGSEGQKQEWLPRMARGEVIGCFGLTEAGAGSDPSSMTTNARRRSGRVGAERREAVDRTRLDRRHRHHLGEDRRGAARVRGADRLTGFHRHPDRAEAVDARFGAVRHPARRRAPARGCRCFRVRSG